jgi:hypothetical protein
VSLSLFRLRDFRCPHTQPKLLVRHGTSKALRALSTGAEAAIPVKPFAEPSSSLETTFVGVRRHSELHFAGRTPADIHINRHAAEGESA